ncbi:hypothetical protein ACGFIF_31690 [Kribbella sp. NPDC049174]|uniref:hypothetical protein n=1 Tax=Kribbella sp. NPDC049174 TaxID=3364112 RepID=UPI00371D36B0
MYGVAQSIRPGAIGLEETAQAWSEVGVLWHFNGIDHGFHCTLFWPAVYLACGVPPEAIGGAQVNDFPTGLDQAIPANEFLHDEDVDIVRLYLAWNRPDRYPTDFTLSAYRQFEAYVRPLLDGAGRSTPPAALTEEDLRRAAAALHPHAFDPPLAVRSVLTALAANAPAAETLLPILTGR